MTKLTDFSIVVLTFATWFPIESAISGFKGIERLSIHNSNKITNMLKTDIKVRFKICGLNRYCYQIFLIQIRTLSLRFCNQNSFEFQILRENRTFLLRDPPIFKFWEMKLLLLLIKNMQTFSSSLAGYQVRAKR